MTSRQPRETPPARPDRDVLLHLDHLRVRRPGAAVAPERHTARVRVPRRRPPDARHRRRRRRPGATPASDRARRGPRSVETAGEAAARDREAGARGDPRECLGVRPALPTASPPPRDRPDASVAERQERQRGDARSLVGPASPRPPTAGRPLRQGHQRARPARACRRPCEDVSVAMELTEVGRLSATILDEVEKAVVGKREALELLLLGVLADGHVLIEDYPGLAKTLMARSFARATSLDFSRIQFTPDLMPSDVTGSSIFNQRESDFEFRPGPIFANLLLADEINRAPPKTQASLLEAMQERQVTTEGRTRRLGPPFLVLATQNPIEYEGTYPLPEAQLDRFLLRMSVGYPAREDEWQVLANRAERRTDEVELTPLVDRETLVAMQQAVEDVYVSEAVGLYMFDVAAATRNAQSIQVGASPRGSLALLKLSRCRAALRGRDYVTPDDVKAVAVPALAHRLTLRPELWVQRISAEEVVRDRLATVPTPAAEDLTRA